MTAASSGFRVKRTSQAKGAKSRKSCVKARLNSVIASHCKRLEGYSSGFRIRRDGSTKKWSTMAPATPATVATNHGILSGFRLKTGRPVYFVCRQRQTPRVPSRPATGPLPNTKSDKPGLPTGTAADSRLLPKSTLQSQRLSEPLAGLGLAWLKFNVAATQRYAETGFSEYIRYAGSLFIRDSVRPHPRSNNF